MPPLSSSLMPHQRRHAAKGRARKPPPAMLSPPSVASSARILEPLLAARRCIDSCSTSRYVILAAELRLLLLAREGERSRQRRNLSLFFLAVLLRLLHLMEFVAALLLFLLLFELKAAHFLLEGCLLPLL